MKQYGEILMLGKCNQRCFYCLGNEMPKASKVDLMNTHYNEWVDFERFISLLHKNNIKDIYLSSVNTEPMLYKYVDSLVYYLIDRGFDVGVRTNGTIYSEIFKYMEGEISISINSLDNDVNRKICGRESPLETIRKIMRLLEDNNKKCRYSILVNEYNCNNIIDTITTLKEYTDTIEYIQLRRWYRYNNDKDNSPYDNIVGKIRNEYEKVGNFYESDIYNVNGVKVSLWNDVFKKESVKSINYFIDGKMSDYNLLVPIYEENKNLI